MQVHGPALRFVREAGGRSIGQLAPRVKVSVSFLARVERGVKKAVSRPVFRALVDELGLSDPRVIMADPYRPSSGSTSGVANCEPVAYTGLRTTSTTRAA